MNYPYVITVSSEKGGVGKTTLATNLAVYLKALREDLPVSIFSFDNHFTVDKMFRIREDRQHGSVADLLLETSGSSLLHTGQYGISYIPSCATLSELKGSIRGPMLLAKLLSLSQIPGIIIIDTRPDLDILTQNAIYAADRVIIPVKDMPSLENCKNIFDLFDRRGLDRKSLTLVPCLVDSRIKYEGPFKDQKELLRGYALNRGYRCMDSYISKSPKVESLNTNPHGRIYPILTHARGTEVHMQFAQLAKQLLEEYEAAAEPRSVLFHRWLVEEEGRKKEEYLARLSGIAEECVLCGSHSTSEAIGFYFEASDGGRAGFLHQKCFLELLLNNVYGLDRPFSSEDPTSAMFRDSAAESLFSFRPGSNGSAHMAEFRRHDLAGSELARKNLPLRQRQGTFFGKGNDRMYQLLKETLGGSGESWRDAFLVVHPADPENPHAVLAEDRYQRLSRAARAVRQTVCGVS